MKSKIAWVMACMTLIAGTATADLMIPTRSSIDPTTPPPIGPEVPLIVGTVVTLDERNVVVDTHDGNTVAFVIDSRTMMPSNMVAGQPMKVQFRVLESGAYFAQRFTPVLGEAGRELAARHYDLYSSQDQYASDTYDSRDGMIRDDAYDRDRGTNGSGSRDNVEAGGELARVTDDNDAKNDGIDDATQNSNNASDGDRLPQTASTGSWIVVLGVVSLAAAGGLSFARRRRSV